MLDGKKLKESEKRINEFMSAGTIRTRCSREDTGFFLTNAENALRTAKSVLEHTLNGDYDGSLWVINASYYSMFYTVRALLENAGIRFRTDQSIHGLAFDAMVYFFYLNKKLEKRFFEVFAEAQAEAAELLGKQKADSLMQDYFWEKRKLGIFTYETGQVAMKNKAQTSFDRAKKFNLEIRAII